MRLVRSALLLAAMLGGGGGLGCDADRAPRPPGDRGGTDAAPTRTDAAGPDGGPDRGTGGPALPPADLEVVLPYRGPTERRTLSVEAELGRLDVHFSIDTTGSFAEEIDAMQAELDGQIRPSIESRVPDVAFGVGRFEDFPVAPFGQPGDRPFELLTAMTTDRRRIAAAFAALDSPLGRGGDGPEAGLEALYQIATGEGLSDGSRRWIAPFPGPAPGGGRGGGVGFREGALRTVVHVTDAPSHTPGDYAGTIRGTRGAAEAVAALAARDVRVLGIAGGDPARGYLEPIALGTGATTASVDGSCPTGIDGGPRPPVEGTCPLVFDVARDGTGLSRAIVDAIVELVNGVRFEEVYGTTTDDPLGFVRAIEANEFEAPTGVPDPTFADRRPAGDGLDDTFLSVGPGTTLRFALQLRNLRIPPADYDQHFRVRVEIRGDGLTLVARTIRVIVPRGRLDGGVETDGGARLDAGSDGGAEVDGDAGSDGGAGDAGRDAGGADGGSVPVDGST